MHFAVICHGFVGLLKYSTPRPATCIFVSHGFVGLLKYSRTQLVKNAELGGSCFLLLPRESGIIRAEASPSSTPCAGRRSSVPRCASNARRPPCTLSQKAGEVSWLNSLAEFLELYFFFFVLGQFSWFNSQRELVGLDQWQVKGLVARFGPSTQKVRRGMKGTPPMLRAPYCETHPNVRHTQMRAPLKQSFSKSR